MHPIRSTAEQGTGQDVGPVGLTGHRNNAEGINRQSLHTLASCSTERNNILSGAGDEDGRKDFGNESEIY